MNTLIPKVQVVSVSNTIHIKLTERHFDIIQSGRKLMRQIDWLYTKNKNENKRILVSLVLRM